MSKGDFRPKLGRRQYSTEAKNRRDEKEPLRTAYNPERRFAAAVMVRAMQDFIIWHSPTANAYRAALEEDDRDQIRTLRKRHGMRIDSMTGPDPMDWLCSDTEFHSILEIEHGQLRPLLADPAKLLKALTSGVEKLQ
jgi:hypothetical protein